MNKKMIYLIFICCLLILNLEVNGSIFFIEPQNELWFLMKGQDRHSKKPCYLKGTNIIFSVDHQASDISLENISLNKIVSLEVQTSYTHNHENAPKITLINNGSNAFLGSYQRSEMVLFYHTKNSPPTIKDFYQFNLRWWHVNHYHNYSCHNLKLDLIEN